MSFPLLFMGVVVAIIVIVLLVNAQVQHRRDTAWKQFASSRQLGWANGQIAGVVSGCTVAMFTETRGQGRSRYTVAIVRCSLPDVFSSRFALERETLGQKLIQLVSGPDHQVGDPKLDAAFLLSNVDGGARRVLSDRHAREALLDYVDRYPSMRIGNGVLQLEQRSVPSDEAGLSALLQDALTLSSTLQRAKQRG